MSEQQLNYYTLNRRKDEIRKWFFDGMFIACSIQGMVAKGLKTAFLIGAVATGFELPWLPQIRGVFAVLLPLLAVAGLSRLSALDCEARLETFQETLSFLERQRVVMPTIDTIAEFHKQILETEMVL